MKKTSELILFVFAYCVGVVSVYKDVISFVAVVFALFLTLICALKCVSKKNVITCLITFIVGVANCIVQSKDFDCPYALAPAKNVELSGTVVSMPSSSDENYTKFYLKTDKVKKSNFEKKDIKAKVLVTIFDKRNNYSQIEPGEYVTVKGKLVRPKYGTNPYEFSYASFLKNKNVFSRIYVQSGNYKVTEEPKQLHWKFLYKLNKLRTKIIGYHKQNLKSPETELLGGIVFGDDAVNPTPEMENSFRTSGLTHIIAASGMNVSMILGMWMFLTRIFGLNFKFSVLSGMLAVICYTCMTGFGPPIMRATLMLMFICVGKLFDKEADTMRLLFFVAFVMMLFSPAIIKDIGFQLSFSVTAGIMLFCPILSEKIKNKILNAGVMLIFVPFVAQLFATPIQMYYFNSFSPYSVLANIAVVPVLSVVGFAGFLSSVLAVIPQIATVVVKIFDKFLFFPLTYIVHVADFFSKMPNALITVPRPSLWSILFYYAFLVNLSFLFTLKNKRKLFLTVGTSLIILFSLTFIPISNNKYEFIFFDVGNADSAIITTPDNKHVLIDTGKAPYKNFACSAQKVILQYCKNKGIRKLDYLILSHYDADHAGGAAILLNELKVDNLVVVNTTDESKIARKIIKTAQEKNVNVIIPKPEEILYKDANMSFDAYFAKSTDENEASMINVFKVYGKNVVFAGDVSGEVLKNYKNLPKNIEVLKVPHHGAKHTIDAELCSSVKINNAVISTGINVYGHPNAKTLEALKKCGTKTFRTDKNGAVKFVVKRDKTNIYTYNTNKRQFEEVKNE